MLLSGKIALQPDKAVLTAAKAPDKLFAKLFHVLTAGRLSDKEKHQTFTAITILQSLNIAFRQAGINNIVRLAKDGQDFYYDTEGRDNDLADTMKDFNMDIGVTDASLFNELSLVLEHEDEQLCYLIDIDIQRVHQVDALPVNIKVSAVIKDFAVRAGETLEKLNTRMTALFKDKDQQGYEHYVRYYRHHYDGFISHLKQTLRHAMRCETVVDGTRVQVLRPRYAGMLMVTDKTTAPLVYRGYPGWDDFTLYTFLWLEILAALGIECSDAEIISDDGEVLL